MTRIKICGLTRPQDVDLACSLGASYLGFNFAAVSPRRVSLATARALARAAGSGIARVGVFVHERREEIEEAIEAAALDLVQIHRPLAAEDLDGSPRPVIAVERVSPRGVEAAPGVLLERCRSVLLDTASDGPGGTGIPFDWNVLAGRTWPVPFILAGGLAPGNVGEAIARVRPFAVDVASGVESSPGIKDEHRMKEFFEAVRLADAAVVAGTLR
jgi:phosphoribosylanthranilate isomerase